MLCYGGHLTLVNLVLTSLSFFMMSFLEIPKAVFGCMNWAMELNWGDNTKPELEMNWTPIPNQLFG